MSQFSGDVWFYRVKEAQRSIIKKNGGINCAAEISCFSPSNVGRWHAKNTPDLMSVPAIVRLEGAYGEPIVSAALQEIAIDLGKDGSTATMPRLAAMDICSQFYQKKADLEIEFAMATADGFIAPSEADAIEPAILEFEKTLSKMKRMLAEARASGGLRVVAKS